MKDKETLRFLKIVTLIAVLIGFVWFVYHISWVIELIFISLLIVYILFPVSEYLKRRFKFSHPFAIGVTFTTFFLLIVILVSLIVPVVQKEIQDIIRELPYYVRQIQLIAEDFSKFLMAFDISPEFADLIPDISSNLRVVLEDIAAISISVVGSVVDIFFIAFIVFYLLYDFQNVRDNIIKLIPGRYEKYANDVIQIVDRNFGGYIRGNIVRCTIVGVATGIALSIAGMPYALLLGILAGVLNIILYIGPYIAAIPAIILSVSPHNPSTVVIVLIYVVIQAIDGTVLSPLLLGRAVKLKPVTVIVCLLIGQQLAGFLGMILSTPFAGITRSLIEYFREGQQKG